jgi:ATP-dependent Lon protease
MQAISYLVKEVQMLELKRDIQGKVKTDMDKQQREYMLHQQMKTIQDELGGNPVEKEIKELKEKGKQKNWKEEVGKYFEKEVNKMSRLNPAAGEYSVQYSYCQTVVGTYPGMILPKIILTWNMPAMFWMKITLVWKR